jgi:hypothetical protein
MGGQHHFGDRIAARFPLIRNTGPLENSSDHHHHDVSLAKANDAGRSAAHVPEHGSEISGRRRPYSQVLGGVYLWKSRAEAEVMFNDDWRTFMRDKYQTDPSVDYFDCPVVVDNLSREILSDE